MQAVPINGFEVKPASSAQIPVISRLAYQIWPETYHFLPAGQVPYMLEAMYSEAALAKQMHDGQHFLVLYQSTRPVGFAAYSVNQTTHQAKLNKLYVLPALHGHGLGRLLLQHVEQLSRAAGSKTLCLNVNRFNPALAFYQRLGFAISHEEDIPIGPYQMNDYVLEKPLFTR